MSRGGVRIYHTSQSFNTSNSHIIKADPHLMSEMDNNSSSVGYYISDGIMLTDGTMLSDEKCHLALSPNDDGDSCSGGDLEELNTRELAQRISQELKRYSIPQAIFAQRVLCRYEIFNLKKNLKIFSTNFL